MGAPKNDKRIKIPESFIQKLQEEKLRTGYAGSKLLRGRKDIPKGVNSSFINNLLKGKLKTAKPSHMQYVEGLYAALPTTDKEANKRKFEKYRRQKFLKDYVVADRGYIKKEMKRSGLTVTGILSILKQKETDLCFSSLSGILTGAQETIYKSDYELIIECLSNAPDYEAPAIRQKTLTMPLRDGYILLTPSRLERLQYYKTKQLLPHRIFEDIPYAPENPKPRDIVRLFQGKNASIKQEDWEFIQHHCEKALEREKMPTDKKVKIKPITVHGENPNYVEKDKKHIHLVQSHMERTGFKTIDIFYLLAKKGSDLTYSQIHTITDLDKRDIYKPHFDIIIQSLSALPGSDPAPLMSVKQSKYKLHESYFELTDDIMMHLPFFKSKGWLLGKNGSIQKIDSAASNELIEGKFSSPASIKDPKISLALKKDMILSKEKINALLFQQKRTDYSPAEFISICGALPVTAEELVKWMSGKTENVNGGEYEAVLEAWRKIPSASYVLIDKNFIAHNKQQIKALELKEGFPPGLTPQIIKSWLGGRVRTAKGYHWDYLVSKIETENEVIRKKLIAAEQAGFTDQTVEEIWAEARQKAKIDK